MYIGKVNRAGKKCVTVFLLPSRSSSSTFLLLNELACNPPGQLPSQTSLKDKETSSTNQGFRNPPVTARIPKPLKTVSTTCKRSFQQGCWVQLVALCFCMGCCLPRVIQMWMRYCSVFLLQRTIKTGWSPLHFYTELPAVSLHVLQKMIHKNPGQRWEPVMGERAAGIWYWYHFINNI